MPTYDYLCAACGSFTALRPMADYAEPQDCPGCGQSSRRAMLTVPGISSMSSGQRTAHATNERSAHAPRLSSAGAHRPGCHCCSPNKAKASTAAKSFPAQRPWMISH